MRIALPRWRNAGMGQQRLAGHVNTVRRLTDAGQVDLIVFPELSMSGYPIREDPDIGWSAPASEQELAVLAEVAEPIDESRAVGLLAELAADRNCAIVFGMAEEADGVVYDTVVLADATGTVTSYRKVHLTDDERRIFEPGDRAVVAHAMIGPDVTPTPIGLSSCWDKQFPLLYQDQRDLGARISIISSAWSSSRVGPTRIGRRDDVLAMQSELFDRARAAETGMVVVSTNYSGAKRPGSLAAFCGGARVVDPFGRGYQPRLDVPSRRIWDVDLPLSLDAAVVSA